MSKARTMRLILVLRMKQRLWVLIVREHTLKWCRRHERWAYRLLKRLKQQLCVLIVREHTHKWCRRHERRAYRLLKRLKQRLCVLIVRERTHKWCRRHERWNWFLFIKWSAMTRGKRAWLLRREWCGEHRRLLKLILENR